MADNRVPGIGRSRPVTYVCPRPGCDRSVSSSTGPKRCPKHRVEMIPAHAASQDVSRKWSVDERRAWIKAERAGRQREK